MVKTVFAVTGEGDEGAGLLIDMTKVTRSTLADKAITLPFQLKRTDSDQSMTNLLILDRLCADCPFYPLPDWIACFSWQPASLTLFSCGYAITTQHIKNPWIIYEQTRRNCY